MDDEDEPLLPLGRGDDDLDAVLDDADATVFTPAEERVRAAALKRAQRLDRHLKANTPDSLDIPFAWPQLVSKVASAVSNAEAAPLTVFRFPIGHLLSDEEFTSGIPDDHKLRERIAHTLGLRDVEARLNQDYLKKHPDARAVGIVTYLNDKLKHSMSHNAMSVGSILNDIPVPVVIPDDRVYYTELDVQRRCVLMALAREQDNTKKNPHRLLFERSEDQDSRHDYMGATDFFPLDPMLERPLDNIIRSNVEAFLRQQYYLALAKAGDGNNEDGDGADAEERNRFIEREVTHLVEHLVHGAVDNIPSYFIENDDLLQLRIQNQIKMETQRLRMETLMVTTAAAVAAGEADSTALVKLRNKYMIEMTGLRFEMADEVMRTLRESDNLADVLKGPEFRTFFNKHCTDDSLRALGADRPVVQFDHKPWVLFIQHVVDGFCAGEGIKEPGTRAALQTKVSALDSQTWKLERIDPSVHSIVFGGPGIGKSMIARTQIKFLPPGIAESMSTYSTQAFNTSTNQDNKFLVQEEGKASLLAPNKEDRERGGSIELNLTKDMMTNFQSRVPRAFTDKETGKTTTVTSISSCHNTRLYCSNFNREALDPAFASRCMTILQTALQGTAGFKPEQLQPLDIFADNTSNRTETLRERITFSMYIVLRSLIKAGVLPAPDRTQSNLDIVAVLTHLGVKFTQRDLHRFLQCAENYQLYYAAYMLCWSVFQAYYHTSRHAKQPETPPPQRWSGEAIITLAPLFWTVTKEATILSLTLLDFLVLPTHVDSVVRDLVGLLGLEKDMRHWKFRTLQPPERHARPIYDVNYVIIEGNSEEDILRNIVSTNPIYVLRTQDVRAFLHLLSETIVTGTSYWFDDEKDIDSEPPYSPIVVRPGRDDAAIRTYKPFEFEKNDGRRPGEPAYRLIVSLHFLKTYFKGLDIFKPDQWKKLPRNAILVDEEDFKRENAKELGYVTPAHSQMVRAIDEVLSTRTLLKSVYDSDDNPVPDVCYEFITGQTHTPIQVNLKIPTGPHPHQFKMQNYRTMLHGTVLLQKLQRRSHVEPVFRENSHLLPPTFAEELRHHREQQQHQQAQQNAVQASLADTKRALGFTNGVYDGDYVFSTMFLKAQCHLGCLPFLQLMGLSDEALSPFLENDATVPFPTPIPIGYGPLSYVLQKKICDVMDISIGQVNYPEDNIYTQLHSSMAVELHRLTPPAFRPRESQSQFKDFSTLIDEPISGKLAFGLAGQNEEAVAAERQAREEQAAVVANFMRDVMQSGEKQKQQQPQAQPPQPKKPLLSLPSVLRRTLPPVAPSAVRMQKAMDEEMDAMDIDVDPNMTDFS